MGTWNLSLIDFCLPPKFRSKEKTIFKPFTIKSYTGIRAALVTVPNCGLVPTSTQKYSSSFLPR